MALAKVFLFNTNTISQQNLEFHSASDIDSIVTRLRQPGEMLLLQLLLQLFPCDQLQQADKKQSQLQTYRLLSRFCKMLFPAGSPQLGGQTLFIETYIVNGNELLRDPFDNAKRVRHRNTELNQNIFIQDQKPHSKV
jgi:hypothetical protein